MAQLTGRSRYRNQKLMFGKIVFVLQVEEKYIYTTNCGGYIEDEETVRWRDATTEDLTLVKAL